VRLRLHYHGILSTCQVYVHLMIIHTVLSQISGVIRRSLISHQIRVPDMRFPRTQKQMLEERTRKNSAQL
jgi:hypothetical protein